MWKFACTFSLLILAGCQQGFLSAPSENNSMPPRTISASAPFKTLDKSIQQTGVTEYKCKDDKVIRIVQTTKTSKKAKADRLAIRLTFERNTQLLLPAVTEYGKKYTNINWHWFSRPKYSTLTTATGRVLAEQCVMK